MERVPDSQVSKMMTAAEKVGFWRDDVLAGLSNICISFQTVCESVALNRDDISRSK